LRASRKKTETHAHYSKGELNRLIDNALHPLFDNNPEFMIVDAILHGLVEQNPSETTLKFIRYSLPKIIQGKKGKQKWLEKCALFFLKTAK
jgi:hypothetical protein